MSQHKNIRELNNKIRTCTKCKLALTRNYAIPGEGNTASKLMLIAQSPGETEDEQNKMFTGPSGKLFNKLLKQAGINRKSVYLTNLIKCMLPNSRRPSREEISQCKFYIEKEIEIIQPEVIVPLGFHSTRFIFIKYGIPRPPKNAYHTLFGRVFHSGEIIIYPLRHPTALLFNPQKRKLMEKNYRELVNLFINPA